MSIFCRTVHLVEAVGSTFTILQTIYLRLAEWDANVAIVRQRTQQQLYMEESVIIIDTRGQEIIDGPGTQGKL